MPIAGVEGLCVPTCGRFPVHIFQQVERRRLLPGAEEVRRITGPGGSTLVLGIVFPSFKHSFLLLLKNRTYLKSWVNSCNCCTPNWSACLKDSLTHQEKVFATERKCKRTAFSVRRVTGFGGLTGGPGAEGDAEGV